MELVLFIGLQASGKSTFYRTRLAATHELVSKDLMPNNPRPERRQRQLVEEALARSTSVAVDNTNPTPEVRAPLIALGHAFGAEIVGYWFDATAGACLARNRQREGRARVPDIAIFATRKILRLPTLEEGFDRLWRVSIVEDGAFTVEPLAGAT
jgi:predicted kinase